MKILTLHCDYIKYRPVKKAIKNAEDLKEKEAEEKFVEEPLVVLVAVEKGDSDKEVGSLVESVIKTARDVKAKTIVLYPYAHLSPSLADPTTAKEYLVEAEHTLQKKGYDVVRAPFGYYKEFELKCKGHPLAELSKTFGSENAHSRTQSSFISMKEEKEEDNSKLLKEISRSKLDTSKLKENDHRILGQKLDLFSFNESSPGSVFWHPNGLIVFNELVKFSREIQGRAGYLEVQTPQIYDNKLWKVSGHWYHYRENMFLTEYEGRQSAIKPMNCPGHMLLYKTKSRSYKDLPLRFSEYSPLHRMELSGVLSGLFRVVRLHQDDTHIFCTFEQLESEISGIFDLLKRIYKDTFNFDYVVELSTRPEKFLGEIEEWDKSEKALEKVLKSKKIPFKVNKGEGAFYGPKIDIHIKDSLERSWQCATIQLDMQLPKRFGLVYKAEDNKEYTPLVIHRALYGSVERIIGILLEHLNGNLPVWLSPIQIRIINFTDRNTKAAERIYLQLKEKFPDLRVDKDFRNTTVSDKVRDAEIMRIPYIVVIGDKEEESKTLAVRERGKKPKFGVKADSLLDEIKNKIERRTL